MRLWIVIALLAALPFASAFALVPKPYIGVNLQSNSPTGDFKGDNMTDKEGGAKSGVGGEMDFGISGGMASAYIGYRFGTFDANSKGEILGETVKATGEWKVNRVVLGARWHLFGSLPSPVVPTLGGGITIGKTTAQAKASGGGQSLRRRIPRTASAGFSKAVQS
jgi:hypothetical protein